MDVAVERLSMLRQTPSEFRACVDVECLSVSVRLRINSNSDYVRVTVISREHKFHWNEHNGGLRERTTICGTLSGWTETK